MGCNCVEKIAGEDPELARQVTAVKRDQDRVAAARKKAAAKLVEADRIKAAMDRLIDDAGLRGTLAGMPHPKFSDSNLLNYVEWMRTNSGHAGRLKAAGIIESVLAAK